MLSSVLTASAGQLLYVISMFMTEMQIHINFLHNPSRTMKCDQVLVGILNDIVW